jgi:flagella basal body P-ring formation protein FlgA
MLLFNATNDSRAVLVATRNLPAGATLTAADVAIAHVRVDDSLYQAALPEQSMAQVVGKQLAEPVHPQQMLVRDQISTRPSIAATESAMTIPVSPNTRHFSLGSTGAHRQFDGIICWRSTAPRSSARSK